MSRRRNHTITGFQVAAPVTWAALPATQVEVEAASSDAGAAPAALVEPLRDLVEAAQLPSLVAAVRSLHPQLVQETHLGVGVWVPDAGEPVVRAVMLLDLLVGDTAGAHITPRRYRGLGQAEVAGVQVQWNDWQQTEVAAGPCLVHRKVVKPPGVDLQYRCEWTLFPPGSVDAAQLIFTTPYLHLMDALTQDAAIIADRLELTLTEVP